MALLIRPSSSSLAILWSCKFLSPYNSTTGLSTCPDFPPKSEHQRLHRTRWLQSLSSISPFHLFINQAIPGPGLCESVCDPYSIDPDASIYPYPCSCLSTSLARWSPGFVTDFPCAPTAIHKIDRRQPVRPWPVPKATNNNYLVMIGRVCLTVPVRLLALSGISSRLKLWAPYPYHEATEARVNEPWISAQKPILL